MGPPGSPGAVPYSPSADGAGIFPKPEALKHAGAALRPQPLGKLEGFGSQIRKVAASHRRPEEGDEQGLPVGPEFPQMIAGHRHAAGAGSEPGEQFDLIVAEFMEAVAEQDAVGVRLP